MPFGISASDLDFIKNEIKKHSGSSKNMELYIFGSRATGKYRAYSDIDLLLMATDYDEEALSRIDFSESDLPYKVDLVLFTELFEDYREKVLQEMVRLEFQS